MKPRSIVYIVLLLLLVPTIAASTLGCYSYETVDVSDVKSDAIHQFYGVNHHADDDITLVFAQFRVGGATGTTLNLNGKSSVTCNGLPLGHGQILGRFYGNALPELADKFAFVLTDAEGAEFNNVFSLPRVDWPEDTPESLSRSEAHFLTFLGPPLGDGEQIYLNINPTTSETVELTQPAPAAFEKGTGESGTTLGRATEKGASGVDLKQSVLKEQSNGKVTIQWTRVVNRKLQSATPAGGTFSGRYFSTSKQFTLTD